MRDAQARTLGRILLGAGGVGTLIGLFVPLMHYPGMHSDYSVMTSAQELGTPGVWWVLVGSVILAIAATLLFERVQTRSRLGAVLILACVEAFGVLAVYAIAFTLIWSDARDFTHSTTRGRGLVEADFSVAALIPFLSCGLIVAGALWWCLNSRDRDEVPGQEL